MASSLRSCWNSRRRYPLIPDGPRDLREASAEGLRLSDDRPLPPDEADLLQRYRAIVENARDHAIMALDADGRVTDWAPGAERVFGWPAAEIIGQSGDVIFTDEDRAAGRPEEEREIAARDGTAPDVRWHRCRDGARVYIDGVMTALHGPDGAVTGFIKIGQDISRRHTAELALRESEALRLAEAERAQATQAAFTAELQHRVRNIMAMVRAIISRTAAGADTVEAFEAHLDGRIAAMGRTQAALTRGTGKGVELGMLVLEELLALAIDEARVDVRGPTVQLAPRAAEILALAVHELAANASKYGAIAQPGGGLAIAWTVETRGDVPWLVFTWRETGVRVAAAAPRRRGFGTELVVDRAPYELGGRGALVLLPGGVECVLEFPLTPQNSVLQTDLDAPP